MNKTKISAVSYLNTLPFVYGITDSGFIENIDLHLCIPSDCSRNFLNKDADIALVPVAALSKMKSFILLNEFCIGSKGNVKTVLLLSQVPLNKISKIHLDYDSVTSVNLVKVLAHYFWKIEPEWINLNEQTESGIKSMESVVAIGNKTFELEKEFQYCYDLSTEWKKFTGLPFVFACWVAQTYVEPSKLAELTKALEWGILNKNKAIEKLFNKSEFPSVNINEYLENNIDFTFDEQKHKALELFTNYLKELNLSQN
ncbi:MAG: menaquinone biosynthesis protein [Bacteroidetes bacterium]|nr:menaquinone biosynthesis protein [Bacteroidota bacterium]